jgi:hypothetical protein
MICRRADPQAGATNLRQEAAFSFPMFERVTEV